MRSPRPRLSRQAEGAEEEAVEGEAQGVAARAQAAAEREREREAAEREREAAQGREGAEAQEQAVGDTGVTRASSRAFRTI